MCNFRVGQKVVCVEKRKTKYEKLVYPDVGTVWRIREIRHCPVTGKPGLRLDGLALPVHPKLGEEFILRPESFRPVVERKTDIEIFRRMLNTTPEKAGAA